MAFTFDEHLLWDFVKSRGRYLIVSERLPELLDDFLEAACKEKPEARFDLLAEEGTIAALAPESDRLKSWNESYTFVFSGQDSVNIGKQEIESIVANGYRGVILCTADSLSYRADNTKRSSVLIVYALELARVMGVLPKLGIDRFGSAIDYQKPLPGHAALRLAHAQKVTGRFYEALAYFRQELSRFPFDSKAHRQMIHFLLDNNRPATAFLAILEWMEEVPDAEWSAYEAARTHAARKKQGGFGVS